MPVRNCRLAEAQELVNSQEILPIVSFSTRSFVIVPHRSTDLVSQLFTDQRSLRAAVRKARKNWNSIVKEVILFTFTSISAVCVFSIWTREGNISLTLTDNPFDLHHLDLNEEKDWQLKTAFSYWYWHLYWLFTQIANGKACIIVVGISCFDYGLHKSLGTKVWTYQEINPAKVHF